MNRAAILAEIKRLEATKAENPMLAKGINDEITKLCDRLKGLKKFERRKVV